MTLGKAEYTIGSPRNFLKANEHFSIIPITYVKLSKIKNDIPIGSTMFVHWTCLTPTAERIVLKFWMKKITILEIG